MDNEKFGVELIALFNQSSFSSVLGKLKNFKNKVGDAKVGFGVDEAELAYVKSQIDDIENKLKLAGKGYEVGDVFKLDFQLAKLKQRYQEIQDKINGVGMKTKEASIKTKDWQQAVHKVTSTIKKTALALVGVRSIYFGLRRAMSTYLAQNEELQNKLNGAFYALGSLFAPVLEKILTWFLKLVQYVDIFVKALGFAGINMKNFNKNSGASAKNVNKMVAGFDEINNISKQDGGGDAGCGGDAGLGNPLADVKVDTTWADRIKDFGLWVKDNWEIVVGLLLGTATAIQLIKLGIDAITSIGIGIAVAGFVMAIASLIEYLKDPSWENFGKILEGIGIGLLGIAVAVGSWPVAIAGAIVLVSGFLAKHLDEVNAFFDKITGALDTAMEWVHKNITDRFGIFGALVGSSIENVINTVKWLVSSVKEALNGIFNGVKNILDGIILIFKGDFKGGIEKVWEGVKNIFTSVLNIIKSAITTVWNNIKNVTTNIFNALPNPIKNAFTSIWNTIKTIINKILGGIEKFVNGAIDAINELCGGLLKVGSKVAGIFGWEIPSKISHISIPRLATGTNYVPNDMVAQIHKGEAVVPKRFNSQEFFGDNEETNSLLRQLINIVDNKEFRAYISQKEVGKSAVDYINRQSRVMGGALV